MNNETLRNVLVAAREKISKRENWTRAVFARDVIGNPVPSGSPVAVCWCSIGAIRAAAQDDEDTVDLAREELANAMKSDSVVQFNDNRSHNEVLEAFDRAIASVGGV